MWSKPIKAQASDGSDVNVLLLDAAGISNERALAGSFDMHKEAEASAADHLQTIAFCETLPSCPRTLRPCSLVLSNRSLSAS